MNDDATEFDPFDAPLDAEEEQESLIAALQMLRGFGLFFAVTNSATERNRRMDAVEAQVPDKKIQRVAVNSETENLLWHLREILTDRKPDGVFVYGLENWISGAVRPRSIPFLLNLNAARDSFPLVSPAPLVLWLPQYVLRAIAEAAPDFFSVRSGVYTFPITPDERDEMRRELTNIGHVEAMGYSLPERIARVQEIEGLLTEYRNLPDTQRDISSEIHLMNTLGSQLSLEGRYDEAKQMYETALNTTKLMYPIDNLIVATLYANLADTENSLKNYSVAEDLYLRSLIIRRKYLPHDHHDILANLNNLAWVYNYQEKYISSARLLEQAITSLSADQRDTDLVVAPILNNLAYVYSSQAMFGEAEKLLVEALELRRKSLPSTHPSIGVNLSNLADCYAWLGRYAEAADLFLQALNILDNSLGKDHPYTNIVRANKEKFALDYQSITPTKVKDDTPLPLATMDIVKRRTVPKNEVN